MAEFKVVCSEIPIEHAHSHPQSPSSGGITLEDMVDSNLVDVEDGFGGTAVTPPPSLGFQQNLASETLLQNASSPIFSIPSPSILSAWEQQAKVRPDPYFTPAYLEAIGGCSLIQGESQSFYRSTQQDGNLPPSHQTIPNIIVSTVTSGCFKGILAVSLPTKVTRALDSDKAGDQVRDSSTRPSQCGKRK